MSAILFVVAKLSPLETWGAIWAIVAGVVAALLFAGGLGRWALDLWRRPRLRVVCGDTKEFNRKMVKTIPLYVDFAEGREILSAHAKFLRIEETRGFVARDVRAWVTAVDPPPPGEGDVPAVKLRWWTFDHVTDIVPRGHDYLFLQQIVVMDDGTATTTPTIFDHHSPLEVEVTLFVGGKRHSRTRIAVEHAWPGLPLDMAMHRNEGDPVKIPDPFPFPHIRLSSAREAHWWSRSGA